MEPALDYLDAVSTLIQQVRATQKDRFKKAADIMAARIASGHLIFLWGPGGHSSIFSEDAMYRKGELAALCPIYDANISLSHGAAREINGMERVEGLGRIVVEYHRIGPGDIVLDPNPHGHGNAAWSLFADLLAFGSTDYDLDQSAARIVTRLFADNQNQLTPFFTIAPRRLLENLLLVYARTILAHPETAGQYRNETLLKYCANLSRENAPAPGELRSYLGNCASDQALGVLGELQASVSALRGFAGGSSPVFSVVDFARDGGGKLLFLEFDASAADTQGPIFGLIEDLAYSTALSPLPQKGKIYFCSDEGPLLGSNVEMLQRALSFGAGQHIGGIFYAAQSNAQLHHCYGEALTESMLADFGTVIALRMKDVTTRRYEQQLCGTCTFPMQHARCGVVTTTLMQVPALPDDQMLSMVTGDAIVLPPTGLPFSFHFLPWAG